MARFVTQNNVAIMANITMIAIMLSIGLIRISPMTFAVVLI
jgi:hypothetical protein